MKKLPALVLCCLFTVTCAFGEDKAADQKWLTAVEKKVTQGDRRISTTDQGRVDLLKKWGNEKGYTVKVTKTEDGYSLVVTVNPASKTVARSK